MRRDGKLWQIGRRLAPLTSRDPRPDWEQADPALIANASRRAQSRPGGGWCVVDASRTVSSEPRKITLVGRDWVLWRGREGPLLAPNRCPHMGAELHCGRVEAGALVCPWHGLRLGKEGHQAWRPVPTYDDGVLVWARLLRDEEPTERPVETARPERALTGVVRMEATCEPEDIVANRLDPWHGAHYHPHSFAKLEMIDVTPDVLRLRVSYRVAGPFCVEVDCTFRSPTRRSILMEITDGDGRGSVVETHATPIGEGRSAVIEATIATSDRTGFAIARRFGPLLRPFVEQRAARLWREDVAYAERRYALRSGSKGKSAQ
ncbi:MAG: DUF5914 domain-containing protein [Myxococcota bacterium]